MSLFQEPISQTAPLAERLRPQTFDDVKGQAHLLAEGGALQVLLQSSHLPSLLLWGPPGTGKTTLAHLLARHVESTPVVLSAVMAGVAELRKVFSIAESQRKPVVLFIDEIHRFNKAQQDALLQPIEAGKIILIGATTENPSFSINNALLSRLRVLTLKPLEKAHLEDLLERAGSLRLTSAGRDYLIALADGDGRRLLNMVESLQALPEPAAGWDVAQLGQILQRRTAFFDRDQDYHYNLISAFIKSMRGSDPQAALYWLARLLEGGEDPRFIARRMIRFATEDVGLADPQALPFVMAAAESYERLGTPEGELGLASAAVFLATAPKSNATYVAFKKAQEAAKQSGSSLPPKHILNAPTSLMRQEGYSAGYIYDHDTPAAFSGQNYFPEGMKPESYYMPVDRGFEREIAKRLAYWQKLREAK